VIKDSRRLFLVSISLKTFEKKQLVLQDQQLANLPLEDLTMINTIIPTDEEYKILCTHKKDLNDIERRMIVFYPYKKLIRLLIFERRFFENKDSWIIGVENIKSVYDTILQSNNIRLLLKTVLELGNTINTNYGNSRKRASAFRICSLVLTKNYKGKRSDQSLLKFVAETARSRLKSIKSDLETIESIRNDELGNYKEIINEYILEYRTSKEWMDSLSGELRANMKAFLFFFSQFVRNFSNEYREAVIYSSIIKRKFGEPENKNVKEIIAILYDFLKSIRHEIEN
ncbi:putative Actin-binding FH2 protein, partial [Trachipleistophora hominis]